MNRVTDIQSPSPARRGNGRRPLRRLTAAGLACGAALALVAGGVRLIGVDTAAAAVPSGYTWDNVQIVGGGFIPGIEFSEAEAGLAYLRTDIGGAYRMDAGAGEWTPLLDGVGWDNWGWNGVASLAPDPVDADRVYAAVGMYTNSWDPNNGAILRSSDRGQTWQASELPFKLGGNMPGRGMGERLAVDPNDNSILYFGAPSGNGLWRSTDSGATWAQVANFPNTGDYIPIPGSEYGGDEVGVVWVTFDGSSASAGQATTDIYVGVADPQNTVYRSTDAGTTWERVAGQPTGFMAHKGVLDAGTGDLYIATSDTGGPYDGSHGDVWKYATGTGEWTQISPVPSSDTDNNYFGYSGLTVDRQNPGTLMVSAYSSWWPDTIFFRSTDGGATWSQIWEWAGYPSRTLHYSLDISAAPWLDWEANPSPPEVTPKLGWMTEAAAIDPFDPDHFLFGTGATVYGTHNLTAWDAGGTADFEVAAKGVEETAVLDLISPPSGPQLVSALGDIGGFAHTDVTQVPDHMFSGPVFTSTTSLDFAGTNPSVMVRAGTLDRDTHPNDPRVAFSTDGGNNWFGASSEPGGTDGGGTVAANADGSRFLWSSNAADVSLSVGFGSSWTSVSGLPRNSVVEADRVDPQRFYAFYSGGFYASTDGGASFTQTAATGLPTSARFQAVPGIEGDIWLAGGAVDATYGLWHSTDHGETFTKVSGVDEADVVGFGKAAPGADYPAIFTSARIDGVRGIYRSDDAGASWVRVNDDEHQYGITETAITGDMRVWGRVYVGTNGRGVVYGDPSGSTPTPTVTPTPTTTTATPTVTPTPTTTTTTPTPTTTTATPTPTTTTTTPTPTTTTTTPTPTTTAGASCEVTYTVSGQWTGGFLGQIMITNTGSTPIDGWTLRWTFPDGQQIQSAWGGIAGTDGSETTLTNESWNASIAPGAAAYPGFIGSWSGANGVPDSFSLNGSTCAVTP